MAITDLGLAYYKERGATGATDVSATRKRPGSDEYSPPEKTVVGRKYDVFSMGCVGCEILVWLRSGNKGVVEFKTSRKHTIQGTIAETSYCFYDENTRGVQPPVDDLLSQSEKEGGLGADVAKILRRMLSYNEKDRPTAGEAADRFGEILGPYQSRVVDPQLKPYDTRPDSYSGVCALLE